MGDLLGKMKYMRLYVLREFQPWEWDSPVGIFSNREFALSEAKRLAELKLKALKSICRKDAIWRRIHKPGDYFMESNSGMDDDREDGFGVYRKNWKTGRKTLMSTPLDTQYYVQEFELDKKAKPLFPGA